MPTDDSTIDLSKVNLAATNTSDSTGTTGTAGATSGPVKAAPWIVKQFGKNATKFDIPEEIAKKNPHLIELVLATESMNEEERDYWFAILPIMNDEQITKFQGILQNEHDQLSALDQKYQNEVASLNKKHANEWQAHKSKEKHAKIRIEEAKFEKSEKEKEEDLLKQLEKL